MKDVNFKGFCLKEVEKAGELAISCVETALLFLFIKFKYVFLWLDSGVKN